jgi:type IV pilus assembly protein PilV
MKPIRPTKLIRNQAGVGLLEILVAVVVLAIGLLGMAGLQTRALQQNQSGLQRSHAVMLTYSILDSLRTDRVSAFAGAYNIPQTCAVPAANGTLRGDTLNNWLQAIHDRFGAVATSCGFINCDAAGLCTIRVIWDDTRAGGSAVETLETRSRI